MNRNLYLLMVIFSLFVSGVSYAQTDSDTLKTAIVIVSGISCKGDMPIIKKKLINQDGVDEVNYSEVKNGKVTFSVKYHSIATTEIKIKNFIESAPSCDDPNLYPYRTKLVPSNHNKR